MSDLSRVGGLDSNGDRISLKVSTGERQSVAEFEEDELMPVFSCLEYVLLEEKFLNMGSWASLASEWRSLSGR